jgi:predicted enzyme related to lactoylglutathione lyase
VHIQFAELPVFDQERATAFYLDQFDCRVVAEAPWQPGPTVAEFRDSEGNRIAIGSR